MRIYGTDGEFWQGDLRMGICVKGMLLMDRIRMGRGDGGVALVLILSGSFWRLWWHWSGWIYGNGRNRG